MSDRITGKSIDKSIATFTTDRNKLRDLAHSIGMMIIYHSAPKELDEMCNGSGDCTRVPKLLEAMPKSWAAQMKVWFETFTPIRVNGSNHGYDLKYKKATAEDKLAWWKIDEAYETPFHALSPEPEAKTYTFEDLMKMASQLAARIKTKIDKGEVKEDDILSAEKLALTLEGLKVEKVVANDVGDEGKAAA